MSRKQPASRPQPSNHPQQKEQPKGPAIALIAVVAIAVAIWVFLQQDDTPLPSQQGAESSPSASAEIHELLASIPVAERDPSAGYSREEFGERWADVDGNGCDQRNDVLRRDLTDTQIDDDGCRVLSGTLQDPFGDQTIDFERGPESSEAVQIDHLVPLNDAWQKGAQHWTATKREQFANDPLNLLAVAGELNYDKGSSDASYWMPPNTDFHCEYVSLQIVVKAHYGLWMTTYERDAFERALQTC